MICPNCRIETKNILVGIAFLGVGLFSTISEHN